MLEVTQSWPGRVREAARRVAVPKHERSSGPWEAHASVISRQPRANAGFTLLELVIVMTILVVLAAIGVVNYQKIQLKTKETLLKQDLKTMRELLDKYAADKEALPQSLDELVSEKYMRDIPVDPLTSEADWATELGDDLLSRDEGKQGIVNVHSKASGVGTDGKAYSEY